MKIRLLKVFIQPVFVIDDGETLEEITIQALPIPSNKWKDFINNEVEGFLKLTEESMLEQLSDKNKESPLSDLGR
jgi:hypothetical protein